MTSPEILAAMCRLPVGKGFPPADPMSAITTFEHRLCAGKLWCVSWHDRAATVVRFPVSRSEPHPEALIFAYHNAQCMLADPAGSQPLAVRL